MQRFLCAIPRRIVAPVFVAAGPRKETSAFQPPGFHAINRGSLTQGATLRTTQPPERKSLERWLAGFVCRLRRDDLAPATVRGYCYDLQQFLRWFSQAKGSSSRLEKLSILDLINYRQHLVNVEALKAATVNRRLKALRRFCRWEQQNRLRSFSFRLPFLTSLPSPTLHRGRA
jgi:Phage integrase, N-terminal SAM-like domain